MPQINFTDSDWDRIERDYNAWWAGQLDRPLVVLSGVTADGRPRRRNGFYGFLSSYPPDVAPEKIVRDFVNYESQRVYKGDSYPLWFINFGPGILAGPLGSVVNATEETVWFDPPAGASLSHLKITMDHDNYWWQRILAVTRAAVDAVGDRVQISYTDLGGNLDILAGLIGTQSLLFELIDRPDLVDRAVADITRLWIEALDELTPILLAKCRGTNSWHSIWAPGTMYMLQCDFSYMISPDMFKRFVMPDLTACCRHIEYPFYHLDGIGEIPHLDYLLSIDNLRGIQWIQGDGKPPAEAWIDLYRRIRAAGKLVQVNVSAAGALEICRKMGSGKGFTFAVGDSMTPAQADSFLKEISALR